MFHTKENKTGKDGEEICGTLTDNCIVNHTFFSISFYDSPKNLDKIVIFYTQHTNSYVYDNEYVY